MKRNLIVIMLAFLSSVAVYAQQAMNVKFTGAAPEINDFVDAILGSDEYSEPLWAMKTEWEEYKRTKKCADNVKFTVDKKNGYMRYDVQYGESEHQMIEMCYWNCADGKHKLVAMNNVMTVDGEEMDTEFSGASFMKYDNASRSMQMAYIDDIGARVETAEGQNVTYALPQVGKNIDVVLTSAGGKKQYKQLVWDGSMFKLANK